MSPLRRRMPDVFGHDSTVNWSERQDFHLRPPGPKPGALKTELRSDKMADPKGVGFPSLTRWMPQASLFAIANCNAPSAFPQTTGCSSD